MEKITFESDGTVYAEIEQPIDGLFNWFLWQHNEVIDNDSDLTSLIGKALKLKPAAANGRG